MSSPSHKPFDRIYLAIVAGLVVFGLFMLASASAPSGYNQFADSYYFVKHQVIFGLIPGLIGMMVFSRIPYTFWRKHAWNLLLVSIGLLVIVFIPGLSAGIGSAHSWIDLKWFTVQPSEFVKLTFLFYLAAWLEKRSGAGVRDVHGGFLPFVLTLGAIIGLLVLQPDVGTMSIIVAMSLVVYFSAGAPIAYILSLVGFGMVGIGALIAAAPYRLSRFMTFLNPELDPQGVGYHINQAMLALGSGGLFGVGYGHSRQKFQYLPEVVGDSIFAVIGEELGLVVCVLLIGAYLYFLARTLKIARQAPDAFGKYLAVGVGAWLTVQAFVNMGSMVAIMPMTGITLPFISYGGTSLAVALSAIGLVLNISRYGKTDHS